jgi:hypothetical protein
VNRDSWIVIRPALHPVTLQHVTQQHALNPLARTEEDDLVYDVGEQRELKVLICSKPGPGGGPIMPIGAIC